jgi:ATP-dependent RNA helicase RhlE
VFGGMPIGKQIRRLQTGADILVATPGRLLDLIEQRALSLHELEILVLDEADQMLDLGFIVPLKRIIPMLPKKRQSLFFSATMPKTIAGLADAFLNDPIKVSVAPVATTAERVTQGVMFIPAAGKQSLLTAILRDPAIARVLVFTRTKHGADKVVKALERDGVPAAAIHGNKSQAQRERALGLFKAGKSRVLVATDIAARGIDVEGVPHVINFELPNMAESYVHRIGRTARAGASGIAISFCANDERPYLRDIEKLTRLPVPVLAMPEGFIMSAQPREVSPARPAQNQRPGGHGKPGGKPAQGKSFHGNPAGGKPNFRNDGRVNLPAGAEEGEEQRARQRRRRRSGRPGGEQRAA